MKPLIIIPARGGSKGVPGKNIKLLDGKPLIQYTLDAAQEVLSKDQICVSTDDMRTITVVEALGFTVPFLRPEHLATDKSGTYEVLLHAIAHYEQNGYNADTLILLQPTSPFRSAQQIKEAIKLYSNQIDMVVSVKETKSNPYYVLFEEDQEGFLKKSKDSNFNRRQDCSKVWELNGAIYIINVAALKSKFITDFTKIIKYEMDEFSSHDIDTQFDWIVAESICSKK